LRLWRKPKENRPGGCNLPRSSKTASNGFAKCRLSNGRPALWKTPAVMFTTTSSPDYTHIMLDVLKFIFSSFWIWLGTVLLIRSIFTGIVKVTYKK
jgi:hypothetical protein